MRIIGSRGGAPRAKTFTASVPLTTGLLTTVSSFGLLAPVTFAKVTAGSSANLSINASTGGISAAAALNAGETQVLNGTATGADGVVFPFTANLTGAVSKPAAPSVTLTAGNGQISIAWVDGPNGGAAITAHTIYVNGAAMLPITSASPYVMTGLTNGTSVNIEVSATNSAGEGAKSAVQSATPVSAVQNVLRTGINNVPALEPSSAPVVSLSSEQSRPILINPTITYQTWQGVGFAMTESAAERFSVGLSPSQRSTLFQEMFGTNGFSYLRVGFGSTDQTYRKSGSNFLFYSYDDVDTDGTLTNFSTARDDEYLVPRILEALAINPSLRIAACIWSPPAYFKNNTTLTNATTPNTIDATPAKLTLYAQYIVLAIQSWQAKGVPIHSISPQNEYTKSWGFPSCIWTTAQMIDFIGNYLGPALTSAGLTTEIWLGDESPDTANVTNANTILNNATAKSYIKSTSWHPYTYAGGVGQRNSTLFVNHPTIAVDSTEYRSLFAESLAQVQAEWATRFSIDIRDRARTFIGWGGALDETGQPNWSPGRRGIVTVPSNNSGAITRNVEYYALAHLGRAVPRGAIAVDTTQYNSISNVGTAEVDISAVSWRKPNGEIVVFAANTSSSSSRDATFVNMGDAKIVTRTLAPGEMTTITMPSDWVPNATPQLSATAAIEPLQLSSGWRLTWRPVVGALGYLISRGGIPFRVVPASQTVLEDATAGTTGRVYEIRTIGNGRGLPATTATLTATTALRTDLVLQFAAPLVTGVQNTVTVMNKSPGSTIAWSCSDGQSGSTTSRTFSFTPGAAGGITFSWSETLAGASNSPVATGPQSYTVSASSVAGTQFLLDTFTGTTNADITSRNGESGHTWTYKTSTGAGTGTITLTAAGATQGAGTMPSTAVSSAAPIHGDYDVIGIFTRTATGSQSVSIGGRCDIALMSGYYLAHNNSNSTWELSRRINGTSAVLGSAVSAITVGQSATATLRMRGNQISALLGGVELISAVTDENFVSGRVDIRHASAVGAGLGLTSVEGRYS